MTLGDLTSCFKAYTLAGVEETLVGKVWMVYTGFEEKFTMVYGVVIERWPIKMFIASSELTWPKVDILLGAWTSGTTYFWKMDQEE
ncbi:hypothetical protein C0992_000759 [Termitomyces sp. T32_za158]|nr:hypothetical protein C0992_000759 [Termitomyces sp. T32_za158]